MILVLPDSITQTQLACDKHALKILSCIVARQVTQVAKWRSEEHRKRQPNTLEEVRREYANVHCKELKAITGNYPKVMKELVSERLIETNDKYSNYDGHKFTKSFRLHPSCWNDGLILANLKQRKTKRKSKMRSGVFTPSHESASYWLDSFDLPEDLLQEYEIVCSNSKWPDLQRAAIAEINQKVWWRKVDGNGRFHTPFTNLNKQLRVMLCCDGSGVVGFDFRNFQPALLTLYPNNRIAIVIPTDEQDFYCSLCKSGTLYDFMLQETNHSTRDEVKVEFLKMLNDKNHRMQRMDVWKVFTRHFPTYSRLVQEIKKHDHRAMATFLQQLESEIMFGDVISRFRELTLDRSPFFTCHDSIYTLKQSRNLLHQSMMETIQTRKIPTVLEQEGDDSITCNQPSIYATMNQLNLRLSL